MAFAIYLCCMIIGMIIFGISIAFGITTGIEIFENGNSNEAILTKWEQEYSDITKLNINLSVCKLNIRKGSTLKVDVTNVSDQFRCEAKGNELEIQDKKLNRNFFGMREITAEVTIYVPENITFKEIDIETGVNETDIEYLKADKVELEMGVGKYKIDQLIANYAKIKAGAGEAKIEDGNIEELKLEGGIGKLAVTSKVKEKADIQCGIGKVELNLLGSPTDYKIKAETGLGNLSVKGQKISGDQTIGNGNVAIKVEAGIGETVVDFIEDTLIDS